MRALDVDRLSAVGRWLLLLLLAGQLLFRREFAHRNLGELFGAASGWPARAYVTETLLLLMLPAAVWIAWRRTHDTTRHPPGTAMLSHGLGPSFFVALAFLLWGAGHAVAAFCGGAPSVYLILRQSAMAGYAVAFLYAFLFFGDREAHVRQAAWWALGVALACAVLDTAGWLKPRPDPASSYPGESLYGQQTLAIAVLALGLFIVSSDSWLWRALALAGLVFAGWRQSLRLPQSVVPIGFGGALALYLALGAAAAWRGQVNTLKRAVLLAAFFGVLFLVYRGARKADAKESTELKAWSWQTYRELFDLYERASVPADPNQRPQSARVAGVVLSGPEECKLETVYRAARDKGGDSVVNNIWRLLMWRRMWLDWSHGRPVLGAGVGKAWEYNREFQHTHFHYEEDAGGLNPHNSYLNVLYRYGVIGLAALAALLLSVLYAVWKALLAPPLTGDELLEGLALFFFYTAVFSFFTVTLEGPSYALPLWASLGLLYARARQRYCAYAESLK